MNARGDISQHGAYDNITSNTTATSTSVTTLNDLSTIRSRPSSCRNENHSNDSITEDNLLANVKLLKNAFDERNSITPTRALFIRFKHDENKLCKSELRREQQHRLPALVFMAVMHAVVYSVLDCFEDYSLKDRFPRIIIIPSLAAVVIVFYCVQKFACLRQLTKECLTILVWVLLSGQVFYASTTNLPRHVISDGLPWVALLTFVTQTTLPVGTWCALGSSFILLVGYTVMAVLRNRDNGSDLTLQLVANGLVVLASMVIGLSGSVMMDRMVKKSVLETKSVLSTKTKIDAAFKEKKALLLSVLPRHVAEEMIQDVGELTDGQFRKIYMSRYENVSILFADIVGFTSISSSVTAVELVQILNELFGNFDLLANRYHQDRIKILGDCYYCVCGALTPRPDHAVLCIHMGLAMVDTISFVRHKTGKDVNMRVGVHTGACLGGVLGQRQWQFDVLGKEVTLANKMESGGVPGRVHISEATKACLTDEFLLEPGHGGDREEELRLKNVTTYLVKTVLKPYPKGTLDDVSMNNSNKNGHALTTTTTISGNINPTTNSSTTTSSVTAAPAAPEAAAAAQTEKAATNSTLAISTTVSSITKPPEPPTKTPHQNGVATSTMVSSFTKPPETSSTKSLEQQNTTTAPQSNGQRATETPSVKDEVLDNVPQDCEVQREEEEGGGGGDKVDNGTVPVHKSGRSLKNVAWNDQEALEVLRKALEDRERNSLVNRGQLSCLTLNFKDKYMETRYKHRYQSYSGLPIVALSLAFALTSGARMAVLPRTHLVFTVYGFGQLVLIVMACVSMFAECSKGFPMACIRFSKLIENHRLVRILWGMSACAFFYICNVVPFVDCDTKPINATHYLTSSIDLDTQDSECRYVVYFFHTTTLTFFALISLVNIGYFIEIASFVVLTLAQCLIYLMVVENTLDNYDTLVYAGYSDYVKTKYRLTAHSLALFMVFVTYNRAMEFHFRKLHLWKEESKREKTICMDLQRRNEALVFNLMPAHVARDFIGDNSEHRGLYSQAYEETGVIFAACPNFHAFYNESAVNNNGLECLRFLNEIISDYDELLNQTRFASIVKIKTVGSTYMAVSGMTDINVSGQVGEHIDCWSHLNDLVQFAFSLQDVIRKINEQSFNNFILRIGINHGPLIAGVIGVNKPHYDVWGNTVNVSSRMESTGQAGRIQVTKDTKNILERFGYRFESRGLIKVKGKGQLATFFLLRTNDIKDDIMPNQVPEH